MKNLFYLSAFVFIFSACGNGGSNSSNSSSIPSIDLTGFVVTDLSDGYQLVTKSNAEGKIKEEGVLKNGKRNGTWVIYQDRRNLPIKVSNFVNDAYSGTHIEYSNTGQIELICRYKNNVLNGKYTRLKNTRILEQGIYVNGEIDGLYQKFYPNKESVQQEINYQMGKLHGASNYYNEEGQLMMSYEYKDGEKISGGMVEPGEAPANE